MPSSAGVVQEAGVPLRPSISTRHRRQEPNASRLSVAQSLGIGLSIRAAAAITDVPGGTLTLRPSMVSVTVGCAGADRRAGVEFLQQRHGLISYSAAARAGALAKSSLK